MNLKWDDESTKLMQKIEGHKPITISDIDQFNAQYNDELKDKIIAEKEKNEKYSKKTANKEGVMEVKAPVLLSRGGMKREEALDLEKKEQALALQMKLDNIQANKGSDEEKVGGQPKKQKRGNEQDGNQAEAGDSYQQGDNLDKKPKKKKAKNPQSNTTDSQEDLSGGLNTEANGGLGGVQGQQGRPGNGQGNGKKQQKKSPGDFDGGLIYPNMMGMQNQFFMNHPQMHGMPMAPEDRGQGPVYPGYDYGMNGGVMYPNYNRGMEPMGQYYHPQFYGGNMPQPGHNPDYNPSQAHTNQYMNEMIMQQLMGHNDPQLKLRTNNKGNGQNPPGNN
jgi:hypothetical protein